MSKRAIIYCRISSDREGRRIGVRRQEEDCRLLAAKLGYVVDPDDVLIENDTGASTRSKKPRPEFEKMMGLAEAGAVDAIIAYSSGRLTRRPMESERLIQLYEQRGTLIHYINAKDNDLSTARGRSRARDDARRDAEEAEEISERVTRDVVRRAQDGVSHGGQRPFGWTVDGRFDPYEHPILLELIDRALAGETARSLVRDLYKRGVPPVRWHPPLVLSQWQVTTIRKMLVNPRIAGLRAHKGRIIGKATWPAAVGEDTWRQLVALFGDPARNSGGSTARVNLLTGLARCGECDRTVTMVVVRAKNRERRDQYACKHCGLYRKMDQVDAYVTAAVVRMLEAYHDDPAVVDPAVLQTVEQLRSRIEATKREFADDDTVTPQELREMLRHLRGRLQAEEAKLTKSRRHHVVADVSGPEAAEAWESLSLDRKRAIIDALLEVRLYRTGPGPKPFDPATVDITTR